MYESEPLVIGRQFSKMKEIILRFLKNSAFSITSITTKKQIHISRLMTLEMKK